MISVVVFADKVHGLRRSCGSHQCGVTESIDDLLKRSFPRGAVDFGRRRKRAADHVIDNLAVRDRLENFIRPVADAVQEDGTAKLHTLTSYCLDETPSLELVHFPHDLLLCLAFTASQLHFLVLFITKNAQMGVCG